MFVVSWFEPDFIEQFFGSRNRAFWTGPPKMALFSRLRAKSFSSFAGDATRQFGWQLTRRTCLRLGDTVDQYLPDELIATLRQRNRDLELRHGVALRRSSDSPMRSAGHFLIGSEQPSLDELVEMKGGQLD